MLRRQSPGIEAAAQYTLLNGAQENCGATCHSSLQAPCIWDATVDCSHEVCRICLGSNCKLFCMRMYNLIGAYEELTGIVVDEDDKMPQKLCFECTARLASHSRFRERSLRANSLMIQIVNKHGKISKETLETINRDSNNLKSPLEVRYYETNHCDLHVGYKGEEIETDKAIDKEERVEIKIEVDEISFDEYLVQNNDSYTWCDNDGVGNNEFLRLDDADSSNILQVDQLLHTQEGATPANVKTEQHEDHKITEPIDFPIDNRDEITEESTLEEGPRQTHSHSTTHINTQTEEKQFLCHVCDYKANQKHKLTRHMKIHANEKPFSCAICDYKCIIKSSLTDHMITHTGDKPFACTICDHRYIVKRSLMHHMKKHTGKKPFSCELCHYRCITKSYLTKHMKTHTDEKPFSCKMCDFKCLFKYNLQRHMKTHTHRVKKENKAKNTRRRQK